MASTSLATRCTACGTVFRVVQDQLLVSDGWVRCGRCAEVFNAAEALIDLDTGKPQEPAAPGVPRAAASMSVAPAWPPAAPADTGAVSTPEPERSRELRPAAEEMPVVDMSASRFAPNEEMAPIDPRAEPDDKPSFVRRAEQAERWRRPGVRAGLLGLALAAGLALVAQIGFEYRDLLAARNPALRPLLERACSGLGCSVDAVRAIDGLSVESSGLVRVEKSRFYKLSVALRNRAGIDVALPALELSLTDSQGQLLSRRVLNATELGVKQATLPAGRELTLQATLQAGLKPEAAPVAGYTIELFYP